MTNSHLRRDRQERKKKKKRDELPPGEVIERTRNPDGKETVVLRPGFKDILER